MTATLGSFPVFRALDAGGAPLVGGLLYSYSAGTLVPLATYVDQAGVTTNANPVVLDSTGSANVWFGSSAYKLVLKTSTGSTLWTVDNYQPESAAATLRADLASTASTALGDGLVGVKSVASGAIGTTQHAKNKEVVSVLDFYANGGSSGPMVDPTGVVDSTLGIQAAIEFVQAITAVDIWNPAYTGPSNIGTLYIPAGVYRITSALQITKPMNMYGDGIRRTTIKLYTSSTATPALVIAPVQNGANLIGADIGNFSVICNAGSAVGNGIYMTTTYVQTAGTYIVGTTYTIMSIGSTNFMAIGAASNTVGLNFVATGVGSGTGTAKGVESAITLVNLHDIMLLNLGYGVNLNGIIYQCNFHRIFVTGTYGGTVSNFGFVSTQLYTDITYNNFQDIQITALTNTAYAFYVHSNFSQFSNIQTDGCSYISSPGGHVDTWTIENIYSENLPSPAVPSTVCMYFDGIASVSGLSLRNVPNYLCSIGVHFEGGYSAVINGLYFEGGIVGSDPVTKYRQPNVPVTFSSTFSGLLSSVISPATCQSKLKKGDLANMIAFGCEAIFDEERINGAALVGGNTFQNRGTWVPDFTTWTTSYHPTAVYATWIRTGRQVTVSLFCVGGRCANDAEIGGLPFLSDATSGGWAGEMVSGDVAKKFTCRISQGQDKFSVIPAQTLDAGPVYWNLSATYFV